MNPGELVVERKRKGKYRQYVNEFMLMGMSENLAHMRAQQRIAEEDRNKRLEIYYGNKRPSS